MFEFYGRLGRASFSWAAALRIGLFLASVIGFPFLLAGLASLTGCKSIGGACGALGVVGAAAFKPLAFAIFVLSFAGISVRRARDSGLPGWTGLFVPLLFAADQNVLVFSGVPWGFAFVAGAMGPMVPSFVLLGLACTAVLCLLPSRARDPGARNPFGFAGWVAFGLGLFVAAFAILAVAASIPAASPAVIAAAGVFRRAAVAAPYAMIALAVVLAWIALRALITKAPELPDHADDPSPLPVKRLVGVAFIITVAVFIAVQDQSWPITMLMQTTTAVLPTMLLYILPLSALYLLIARPTLKRTALLALALLPFAHWAYARQATAAQHRQEAAEIAAIPTTQLSGFPATIVFEGDSGAGARAALKIPGVDHVILGGAYGAKLMQIDRTEGRPASPPRQIAALPDRYLLLKAGRSSRFAVARTAYAALGGPLELRLVEPPRDDLVAVWYRAFNPAPAFLPLLTTSGWYRGSNSATSDDVEAGIARFLRNSLTPAG